MLYGNIQFLTMPRRKQPFCSLTVSKCSCTTLYLTKIKIENVKVLANKVHISPKLDFVKTIRKIQSNRCTFRQNVAVSLSYLKAYVCVSLYCFYVTYVHVTAYDCLVKREVQLISHDSFQLAMKFERNCLCCSVTKRVRFVSMGTKLRCMDYMMNYAFIVASGHVRKHVTA